MKMHKEDLIKARITTQELLAQTMVELLFSIIALLGASVLATVYFPEVVSRMLGLVWLLIGVTFGTVIGVARAYAIFWNRTDFKEIVGRDRANSKEKKVKV